MSCGHWCILSNNQDISYPVLFFKDIHFNVTSSAMFNMYIVHSKVGIKKRSNRLNMINFESIIFHNERCSGFDIDIESL